MNKQIDKQAAQKLAQAMGDECIAFRVRALNRIVTNLYDAALSPLNVTVNQATMLIMLSLVGEATPGRIGQVLIMEKSTISRNLDRMKKQGWVETAGRDGGKEQVVRATPAGRTLLVALHPIWEAAQKQVAEFLGSKGVSAVHTLHEAVRKKHPV
ncbi:MAG: winged helix-turn-helix transcriptional regulator [Geobacteraceae bacterium]|nr:winged helix-turn-helix transcriptional regulator [Geobacteraceae bacterium]